MKLNDFLACLEKTAPQALAMDFDNPGLLISPEREEIKKVLVALDCTTTTAKEAAEMGADLLLTHHPIFFRGVKHIRRDDPETAAAWELIRHGVGLFSAHTNLDAAEGGVNDALAAILGLQNVLPLPPENLGRIAELPEAMYLRQFAAMVESRLSTTVHYSGEDSRMVQRVALIGGSGGSDVAMAHAAGADVFVTGEVKHHEALMAEELGLCLVAAGHYETERVVLLPWIRHLQSLTNDVQYSLTLLEKSCLKGL